MWTIINDSSVLDAALTLCRGSYQRNLLLGRENLSGSTLKGKAKSYSGKYAASRRAILARCAAAKLPISETTGSHGKRLLVIG